MTFSVKWYYSFRREREGILVKNVLFMNVFKSVSIFACYGQKQLFMISSYCVIYNVFVSNI